MVPTAVSSEDEIVNTQHPSAVIHPAVIIGAGHFGLAIAHELQKRGVSVPILDAADRVASAWRQRHPQLRLNTHRLLSSLPGLRMPRGVGAFPSRDDVVRYLEAYEWRIDRPIEYRTHVQRIEPDGDHWRVETGRGPVLAEEVIVATGRERVGYIPDWPGKDGFRGELRSAADLGDVSRYAGKRVLVVGCGTSGSDALNHLARVDTRELLVSVRHGPAVLPTRLLGLPIQLPSPLMTLLPARMLDAVFRLTQRLVFGDLRRHGLDGHPDGAATRLIREGVGPAFDLGFVAALKAGRLRAVPTVQGFDGVQVLLADGSRVQPDVVICATGYRPGLESMVGHLGVLDERGVPRTFGRAGQSPLPGLRFVGMTPRLSGQFLAARGEAKAVARELTSRQRSRGRLADSVQPAPAIADAATETH